MPRRVWLGCLVSLVMVGCSSGSSKPSATGATTTVPTTGSSKVTATTKVPTFSGSTNSKYCNLARQFSKQVNVDLTGDVKATFQQFDAVAPQFLDASPSEIKSDANLLVNGVKQVETALKAVNYDYTKIDPANLQGLQDPKFAAASDRITAYNAQVCGINTTSTT